METVSDNRKRKFSSATERSEDVKKQRTLNIRKIPVPVHRLVTRDSHLIVNFDSVII